MVKIYLIQVIRIPLSTFILLLFLLACNNEVEKKTFDYPFQNPALPVDERIDDLIFRVADTITLSVKLSNKGPMDGEEVIQVYARKANPAPDDPVEVLAGFKRAFLRKNSQETVEMKIPVKSFARWNSEKQEYITPAGRYFIGAGKNSAEILQEVEILVK